MNISSFQTLVTRSISFIARPQNKQLNNSCIVPEEREIDMKMKIKFAIHSLKSSENERVNNSGENCVILPNCMIKMQLMFYVQPTHNSPVILSLNAIE